MCALRAEGVNMAEITFFEGRPDFQWEQDLLLVLASSGITDDAGTVTLYYDGPDADLLPDAELILTGTGLDEFYGGTSALSPLK